MYLNKIHTWFICFGMNKVVKKILHCIFRIYFVIAALVGTAVISYPFIVLFYNALYAPAPLPVMLPNGFIYEDDHNVYGVNQHIVDRENKEIIAADVISIMWSGNTVYGFRRGPAGEGYYFICNYGEDCSKSQNYNDIEFTRLLKEKGLPEFTRWERKTYEQLLKKEGKIDGVTVMRKGG